LPLQDLLKQFRVDSGGTLGRALIRSSLGVSGILALDVCLSIATAILLARSLGVAGLGIYSVGLATGRILSPLLQLGLPNLLTREVNHGHARGEMPVIRGVVQFTFAVCAGLIVVFAVTAYLAWPLIAARLPGVYVPAIFAGLFFAPAVAVTNICSGGLQGWHKVSTAAASTTVLTSGGMLAMVAAALILYPGWLTPGRTVALNVGAQSLALTLTATLFVAYTLQRIRGAAPSYSVAAWRRSMLRFTAVSGLMIAEQQMLTFALGALASETQVGPFRIAQRAAALAIFWPMAVDRVLAPHIGQSYARSDKARLQKLVTRGAQAMGLATLVVFLGFAALGGDLLEFAVGPEFRPAYLPLVILSFGFFVRASFGPTDILMNMTGHEGTVVRARALAMTVTLATAVTLMGENAAIGASVATLLGLLVMALMLWRDARRLLNCRTSALGL